MVVLCILLRGLVAFLGFTLLLGILWFSSSPGGTAFVVPGVLMGLSSLVVALLPIHKKSSGTALQILVITCFIGIGSGFVLLAKDLGAPRGIEWDVVAITLLHIAVLASIVIIAIKNSKPSPG